MSLNPRIEHWQGRTVWVVGASSGIGQALAGQFYAEGYSLALVARRTQEIEHWAAQHGLAVDRFRVYQADVSDIDSIVSAGQDRKSVV